MTEDAMEIEALLGQPLMVRDARITFEQAAAVLNKSVPQVRRYLSLGRLERHGSTNNQRPLLLSQVEALRDKGEPITIKEAARKLSRSVQSVRELTGSGHLQVVPGTRTMLYPADVRAAAPLFASGALRRIGPPGHIDTAEAARRLAISPDSVRRLAAAERIKAVVQNRQYWFDPKHIEMAGRARRARQTRTVNRPYRSPGNSAT